MRKRPQRGLGIAALSLLWLTLTTLDLWAFPRSVTTSASPIPLVLHPAQTSVRTQSVLFHPIVYKNVDGQSTTIFVQNTTNQRADYVLTIFNPGGTPVNTWVGVLGNQQTAHLSTAALTNLPAGVYHASLTATVGVQSVARTLDSEARSLALYQGMVVADAGATSYFGPVYKEQADNGTAGRLSQIVLINGGVERAQVRTEFYALDGNLLGTDLQIVAPNAHLTDTTGLLADLPADFVGWARVTADQPTAGLLVHTGVDDGLIHQPALATVAGVHGHELAHAAQSFNEYLPRALNGVDEGGGARTTQLFFIEESDGFEQTRFALQYLRIGNSVITAPEFSLDWHHALFVNLGAEPLNSGVYGVRAASNRPLLLGELTSYSAPSTFASASYGTASDHHLYLPRLVRSDTTNSAFSIQNVGTVTTTATITYTSLSGRAVAYSHATLSPGAALRFDQRLTPALGEDFEGSARIGAAQPLKAWVDEYINTESFGTTSPAPFQIQVAGPLLGVVGEAMRFAAIAAPPAEPPIGYGWQPTGIYQIRTLDNTITGTATITWTEPGVQVVTAIASAASGENRSTYTVTVGALRTTLSPDQSASLVYTNSATSTTSLTIPAGAVTATHILIYTPVWRVDVDQAAFVGYGFIADAPDENGQPLALKFDQPIHVAIQLEGSEPPATGRLELRRWGGRAWLRGEVACTSDNLPSEQEDERLFRACIDRTGLYALFVVERQIFVPLVAR